MISSRGKLKRMNHILEVDTKDKRGRDAGHKTIVFGILERGGKVSVSIVTNVSAESLMTETVKKVRRGSIVYTDKWVDMIRSCSVGTSTSTSITETSSSGKGLHQRR